MGTNFVAASIQHSIHESRRSRRITRQTDTVHSCAPHAGQTYLPGARSAPRRLRHTTATLPRVFRRCPDWRLMLALLSLEPPEFFLDLKRTDASVDRLWYRTHETRRRGIHVRLRPIDACMEKLQGAVVALEQCWSLFIADAAGVDSGRRSSQQSGLMSCAG